MKTPDFRLQTPDAKESGFTLLELIIAFTITGLILLIIGSGLRLGIRAWEKGEGIVDESQRMRILWERFSYEVRSTYPYQIEKDGEKKIAFEGKSDSLSFVTAISDEGFKWVSYYVKDRSLMLKEKRLPDKELNDSKGKEATIESGVEEIRFEYYEEKQDNWETSWDVKEKGRLPDIIKLTIIFEGKKKESFPPILISVPVAYNPEEGR